MPPERLCTYVVLSYSQHCVPLVAIYWRDFPTRSHSPEGSSWQHIGSIFVFLPTFLLFDALNDGDTFEVSGLYLVRKTRIAGLQSGVSRMMIDSVVWAQYINVTNTATQTATQPRRYSNSPLMHFVLAAKIHKDLVDCTRCFLHFLLNFFWFIFWPHITLSIPKMSQIFYVLYLVNN